jgi:hypothetical protein
VVAKGKRKSKSDSGYSMKAEATGVGDELDVGVCKRGVKDDSRIFGLSMDQRKDSTAMFRDRKTVVK